MIPIKRKFWETFRTKNSSKIARRMNPIAIIRQYPACKMYVFSTVNWWIHATYSVKISTMYWSWETFKDMFHVRFL